MTDNKTKLLALNRALKAAFSGKEEIRIDDLTTLIALIHLPVPYQALRTTLEETNSTTPSFNTLFTSIIREESAQLNTTSNRPSSRSANSASKLASSDKCKHGRPLIKCWTCTPSARPTCIKCKDLGVAKFQHKTDSEYCQFQQHLKHSGSSANQATLGELIRS
jgi:hypothetical protein